MGNIRCPRCRKMINEKDKKCDHCGYDGIDSYKAALIRAEEGAKKKEQERRNRVIHNTSKYSTYSSTSIKKPDTESNVPKCPTCSSTNIKKIGSVNRAVSIALLGIFSSKIGKQFQCLECGYKW